MNKEEIIRYIRQNGGAETAVLQKNYGISYGNAKAIINEMLSSGELVYAEGVRYDYVGRSRTPFTGVNPFPHIIEQTYSVDGEAEGPTMALQDEDTELMFRALWLFIEMGSASVSLLQRRLPIGFVKANRYLEWMEDCGFISPSEGPWKRKVLITKERFKELFPQYGYFEDDDIYLYDLKDDGENEEVDASDWYEEHHAKLFEEYEKAEEDFKAERQKLAAVIDKIAAKKSEPISKQTRPEPTLWLDEKEFTEVVSARFERLIKSDKNMGQRGAVKRAEAYLEAVRDTHDGKMVQVYERLVYEVKNTSAYFYSQLKKYYFEE